MTAAAPRHSFIRFRSGPESESLLEGVALNAVAADRTITLALAAPLATDNDPVACWDRVAVKVDLTRSTATTVTATPRVSMDKGATFAPLQFATAATPSVLSDQTYSKTVAADASFEFVIENQGWTNLQIEFGGAGAGAGDLITVQATARTN